MQLRLYHLCIFVLYLYIRPSKANGDPNLSFECPVTTTCPTLCVAKETECPREMRCEGNLQLCLDGTCNLFCPANLESPCLNPCAPVACAPLVTSYSRCESDFGDLYAISRITSCFEEEEKSTSKLSWLDPGFIFAYVWFGSISLSICAWCRYNQRIRPVAGSCVELNINAPDKSRATQTGYKRCFLGNLLYTLTLSAHFGWFVLLGVTTSLLYEYEDDEVTYVMVLKAFAIVFHVGFLWSMVLYSNHRIEALFLRRCLLSEASFVAITREVLPERAPIKEPNVPKAVLQFIQSILLRFDAVTSLLFSRPFPTVGIVEFCPIRKNSDGTMYFIYLFKRYNYNREMSKFAPGEWNIGRTFREIVPQRAEVHVDIENAYLEAISDDRDPPTRDEFQNYLGRINPSRQAQLIESGLSDSEVLERIRAVGPNKIEMRKPSLFRCLCAEFSKPFYLYQFYILWVWMTIQYWFMSIANWSVVAITACMISWFQYNAAKVLYGLSQVDGQVKVCRNGIIVAMEQRNLVPGDIVLLTQGTAHCDMLLISGKALMDESALTGEATPQLKVPVDGNSGEVYDVNIHKRQTIFAGTKVFETEQAMALVVKTASDTMKGDLLRDMLVFRRLRHKYEIELPVVVGLLVLYGLACFVFVCFNSSSEPVVAWSLGMTAFSNAFPALLPISFTVPLGISVARLARSKIACSQSENTLVAGKVNIVFFDKTGTLTKQGLDFISGRSKESWNLGLWLSDDLRLAMAVCHNLIRSKKTKALIGNPVDKAMFTASKARLSRSSGTTATVRTAENQRIQIVRKFDFDRNRMTQSVVVLMPNGDLRLYVKGSGESIRARCLTDTIPSNFSDIRKNSSRFGIYQIYVAMKRVPDTHRIAIHTMSRDEIETDLSFVGVLNFENCLREKTLEVVQQLIDAEIQPLMVTGDDLLTGINVSKKSFIVDSVERGFLLGDTDCTGSITWRTDGGNVQFRTEEVVHRVTKTKIDLAMTGTAWRILLEDNRKAATTLAPFVRVFGRCSPDDKVSIVDTFVRLGYTTMMVGDGGNDCGALKAAHVGLALSDSEASIVSPFTSLEKDIESVLTLLKEGRCAVASKLACYKYLILYGIISSYCQLILYTQKVSFSDWMWVFTDGVWTLVFSLTLPLAQATSVLSATRPTSSLLGWHTFSSLFGIVVLDFIFMIVAFWVLSREEWYDCRKWNASEIQPGSILLASDNYETTVNFLMVGYQCLFAAMAFNSGYEFRRSWWRNYVFVVFFVGFTAIHMYITMVPGKLSCLWRVNCVNDDIVRGVVEAEPLPINNPFNTTVMPFPFRVKLLMVAMANGLAIAIYEYFCVNGVRKTRQARRKECLKKNSDENQNEPIRNDDQSATEDSVTHRNAATNDNTNGVVTEEKAELRAISEDDS